MDNAIFQNFGKNVIIWKEKGLKVNLGVDHAINTWKEHSVATCLR